MAALQRPHLDPGELTRTVRYVLRPPALVLPSIDCPDVLVLAKGRTLGLVLRHGHMLSGWQKAHIPALRQAGMVIWLVDTLDDAIGAMRDFGCALRPLELGSGHELR